MIKSRPSKTWLKSTALAAILAAGMIQNGWAAGLQARVNSSIVAMGDSFQLILSTQDTNASQPDLGPLSQDFKVQGTSQSSQTQIINGRRTDKKSWIVTLTPKKKGELTIPALQAGNVSSEKTSIKVLDASAAPKAIGINGVSVTASIEPGQQYVFSEIPLTIRIETDQAFQDAGLIAPQGDDFELSQLGEDRSSQVVRNGRPVTIIERNYMLRPQKAGSLTLPPFVLKGSIPDPRQKRDPFFDDFGFGSSMMRNFGIGRMFQSGKPFKVRSDSVSINVLANPNGSAQSNDWFLPAKAVQLKAEWAEANPTFKIGEAITRRISLLALGARPEQLPDLDLGQGSGVKLYVDDSKTDLVQTNDGTIARKDILVSVVPTQGGSITLPEIRVNWLDTKNNKEQTAILPALTIQVEGAAPLSKSPQPVSSPASTSVDDTGTSQSFGNLEAFGWLGGLSPLQWGLLTGGLAVLAIGAYSWQSTRSPSVSRKHTQRKVAMKYGAKPAASNSSDKQVNARKLLIRVVKSGQPNKSYESLMTWLRLAPHYRQNPKLQSEICKLEQILFDPNSTYASWNNSSLLTCLRELGNPEETKGNNAILPSLYPTIASPGKSAYSSTK